MIEAIILSVFTFIIGGLVGASIMHPFNRVKSIRLPNGSKLDMWRGFVDHSLTYVGVNTSGNGDCIDGDGVIFDENGNIIFVEKTNEARCWQGKECDKCR